VGADPAESIVFSPLAAMILAASLIGLLISARSPADRPRRIGHRCHERRGEPAYHRREPDRLLGTVPGQARLLAFGLAKDRTPLAKHSLG
jgi:hypothetical protein